MGPQRFVQVAMPGHDLPIAAATRRRGKADLLVEAVVRPPAEQAFHARAMLADVTSEDASALAGSIGDRYRTGVDVGAGRLSFDVRPADLPSGMFDVLLAFQASFGPVWMHVAKGRLTLRAQAVGCTPEDCAKQLRKALRLAGIRRQVRVVDVEGPALEPWLQLVAWRDAEEPVPMASPA